MKTKVFTLNDNKKIEFTEKELKSLLDEIYNDGYNDGRESRYYYYYTPYRQPYYTWTTSSSSGSAVVSGLTVGSSTASTDTNTIKYECPSVTDCKCNITKEEK